MEYEKPVSWKVEVYSGKTLTEVITVKAKTEPEASKLAFAEFSKGLNVKIKRAYN
jgi:hypothetical protein